MAMLEYLQTIHPGPVRFPKVFRVFFVILLIGVAVFVTLAAHNGGRLVYEYGV